MHHHTDQMLGSPKQFRACLLQMEKRGDDDTSRLNASKLVQQKRENDRIELERELLGVRTRFYLIALGDKDSRRPVARKEFVSTSASMRVVSAGVSPTNRLSWRRVQSVSRMRW